MKKVILIFLYIAFTATPLFSQNYQWAMGLGGNDGDARGNSIDIDALGNVYVTGFFRDTVDFDPGPGQAVLTVAPGKYEMFIAKYDSNGSYIWAKDIGEPGTAKGHAIKVNNVGVYVTGEFWGGTDFDPSASSVLIFTAGGYDSFLAKYDTAGNYIWAIGMGGSGTDRSNSLAVDSIGNCYITGDFIDTADFDPGPGTASLIAQAGDAFFAKYDSGGTYSWAHRISGHINDWGRGIIVDYTGVVITGQFTDTADFDTGPLTFNLDTNGGATIYLAKYDTAGAFIWAGKIGGNSGENAYAICADQSGNGDFYITGNVGGTADFDLTNGVYNITAANGCLYFAKYNNSGNLIFVKVAGSGANGRDIVCDSIGNIYLTGVFAGTTDFDPGVGTSNLTANGGPVDIFFARYDNSGNYDWAKSIGGLYTDFGKGIAISNSGSQYVTGYFNVSMDCDPGSGSAIITGTQGGENIFIGKYSPVPNSITDAPAKGDIAITLFPNPAIEYIAVGNLPDEANAVIKIADITGKELYNSKVLNSSMTIDVSPFSAGIYFVEVFYEGKMGVRKFVKE